jgi:hypothetical protein
MMRPSNDWHGWRETGVCARRYSTVQVSQSPFDTILQSFFNSLGILPAPIESPGAARHSWTCASCRSAAKRSVQRLTREALKMTYEEVCELAVALGVWLESLAAAPVAGYRVDLTRLELDPDGGAST